MATFSKLKEKVTSLMNDKGLWENSLVDEIPKHWEKYGDTVLIDKDRYLKSDAWKEVGPELWLCLCEILNANQIALRGRISSDGFRTPNVELVWGNSIWVECKDNGIIYTWNIMKSMFSAGNASERHRVAQLACDGDVVVDMYAGIGYFTLPYLVHAKAALVHACEWNPYAVEALRKNLTLNKVDDKCVIHEGDNHTAQLDDTADRVNCGLLPSSKSGWELACKFLKSSKGGILHIHENVESGIDHSRKEHNSNQLVSVQKEKRFNSSFNSSESVVRCENCCRFFEDSESSVKIKYKKNKWKLWTQQTMHNIHEILLRVKSDGMKWKVLVLDLHRVKSYAPHIDHLVLDLECRPYSDI